MITMGQNVCAACFFCLKLIIVIICMFQNRVQIVENVSKCILNRKHFSNLFILFSLYLLKECVKGHYDLTNIQIRPLNNFYTQENVA